MLASLLLFGVVAVGKAPAELTPLSHVSAWWMTTKTPKWDDYRGKVLIVHTYPSFCCGWDQSVKLVRGVLDKWPGRVAALTINYGTLSNHRSEFDEARKGIKIDWPVGVDPESQFADKFFPGESVRYTFTLIDKKGNRSLKVIEDMDKLAENVEALLKKN
jgi:hypothetical protein